MALRVSALFAGSSLPPGRFRAFISVRRCVNHKAIVRLEGFLSLYLSIYLSMVLQPFVGPWSLFQFLDVFYTVGRTPWTGYDPVTRPLPTNRTVQTQNKSTHTSTSQVGFEPTISLFEGAKTVKRLG
jgi:hypothetical protein